MEKQEFLKLIDWYLEGNASAEEKQLLYNYYDSFQENDSWDETLMGNEKLIENEDLQILSNNIAALKTPVRKIITWKKWVVAASVIFMVGIGGYFTIFTRDIEKPVAQAAPAKDVAAPTTNRAMITLANGEKIFLDNTANGTLGSDGTVKIVKLDNGNIVYQNTRNAAEVTYNTIINPQGSRVQTLVLTDGTQVWLNAGSSLRYPTAFIGSERKVELSGEGYFAVVHNEKMPFKVMANGVEIEDLGTEFNINSYADEPEMKVTLVNGLLQVKKNGAEKLITPGQQAKISDIIKLVKNADLDNELAWKNGFFAFHEADLKTVMRQLARWYDIEISYEGNIYQETYSGSIGKDLSLKDVLDGLTRMKLKFRIEGNKVTILQ